MADLGQIESATIQTQVYQRLREGLFDGAFSPGQSLTIRNLAAGLGTSPMPVREALQRLVAERALVQLPNRTFQVTPFTTEMFRELTRVRMSVEGLAAGEAARRTRAEDVRMLQKLNKTMIRGIEKNDLGRDHEIELQVPFRTLRTGPDAPAYGYNQRFMVAR